MQWNRKIKLNIKFTVCCRCYESAICSGYWMDFSNNYFISAAVTPQRMASLISWAVDLWSHMHRLTVGVGNFLHQQMTFQWIWSTPWFPLMQLQPDVDSLIFVTRPTEPSDDHRAGESIDHEHLLTINSDSNFSRVSLYLWKTLLKYI